MLSDRKIKIFCAVCLCVVNSLFASQKTVQSESHSGIKFIFMKENSAPLVHIKLSFQNCGAAYLKKEISSLPLLYSDAVFCGAGNFSASQLKQKLQNISVLLYSYSSQDDICFGMTSPKIVLSEAVGIFNDVICRPKFEEKEVKIIQNEIFGSLQNYAASPSSFATKLFLPARIFRGHQYAVGVNGNYEDILKLNIDDLKNYKSNYLVTSNVKICVFGDLTEEEAKNCIDKIFAGVKKGNFTEDIVKNTEPILSNEDEKYPSDGPQTTIVFALKTVKPDSPQYFANVLLYHILGGGVFKSRIMSRLRSKEGLIYSGGVQSINLKHADYARGILITDNSKVEKAIDSLKDIIRDMRTVGITELF